MKEWKQIVSTKVVPMHRGGWIGVWDALRAVLRRESRFQVAREITVSFWVEADSETKVKSEIAIAGSSMIANGSYAPGFTMTPLQMIAEWRKGCSCSLISTLHDLDIPCEPTECKECTAGLIDMIERHQRAVLAGDGR